MPRVVFTPRANGQLQSFQNGGWSQQDVAQLRQDIQNWINSSWQGWQQDRPEYREFQGRYPVSVYAELIDKEEEEVEVTQVNID